MFKYTKDGVSVLTILDTRRSKQNGLFPIKIQVVHNRVQRYYPTGKELSTEDWKILGDTKSKRLIAIRGDVKNSFEKVESVVRVLVDEGVFSFDVLNIRLGKSTNDTVNSAFKAKISVLEDEERTGSQLYYSSVLNSISAFAGNDIRFDNVTVEWLRKYEKHMLKEGKTFTTVGMYMRATRAIMNEAKRASIIKESHYPFGKGRYEIPAGEGRKLALNMQQIKSVITYTDGRETTERYRDLWFFSYLCNGINFTDLLKLKYSNIVGNEICFYRQKTIRTSKVKREIQAVLTPEMRSIIDRWGNSDRNFDDFIFPYLRGDESPMQEKKNHS